MDNAAVNTVGASGRDSQRQGAEHFSYAVNSLWYQW